MSVNLRNTVGGYGGLVGSQNDLAGHGFIVASAEYTAASVDKVFFVAARPMRVVSVVCRVETAGTDAGAVTAAVKKAASGTAIASGTALHSSTANLKGTAATNQTLTLSTTTTDLEIAAGTAIGADFTGTMTAAAGVITVTLAPM